MKQVFFTIQSNRKIAKDVMEMVLLGDTSAITAPGQFVNIKLDGYYLRRPISVCDYDANSLTIIYKAVGEGTRKMCTLLKGDVLDVLTGLGNGYQIMEGIKTPLLIGGGVGVPPMFALCKALLKAGQKPTVLLGFNTEEDVFYAAEFAALGVETIITTADGSCGKRGFVTDALSAISYDYFYTCGPEAMLRAVYNATDKSGQMSFEERMGCGFGACMGCSCKTKYGNKRICKDGPVLVKEEIIW